MRIASNSFGHQFLDQLQTLNGRQSRLQAQAATGQRIQTADDDPTAMKRVLDLQGQASALGQYQKNVATLTSKAAAGFDLMRGLKKISDRVGELATLADGTRSPDELKIFGTEVGQLLEQAAQLVNGRHNEEYLLGGTRSDQPPFVITRNADGGITGVAYQGNQETPEVDVGAGTALTVQIPGANATGAGSRGLLADSRTGADFFAHLIEFQKHLNAGDSASVIRIDRPNLRRDEDNLLLQIGTNAAIQTRLEAAGSLARSRGDSVEQTISGEVNADLAETLVALNRTQTAYQAALQSGATIMQLSLLNYIR